MAALPPLQHEVRVDLNRQQAFELFTNRIGDWWPLATHGLHGAQATVAFTEEGRLVERHGEQVSNWAEVTEWVPGERIVLAWHPGRSDDQASQVTVTFTAYGEQTLVTLVHAGWEVYDNAIELRTNYASGWPAVMARYATAGTPDPEPDPEPDPATWAALLFTPAANQGAAVFEDERFAGHPAFLNEMEAAGYLVAAGPMLDHEGTGMTILRLPGDDRLADIEQLAHEDASVSSGLFEVTVRPWRVFFAPGVASATRGAG